MVFFCPVWLDFLILFSLSFRFGLVFVPQLPLHWVMHRLWEMAHLGDLGD